MQPEKTCSKGHPLEGDNLAIHRDGDKTRHRCVTCARERSGRHRAKVKAANALKLKKTRVQQFHERYLVNPATGCWEWQRGKTAQGYGAFSPPPPDCGTSILAHRISWWIHRGPIPDGLTIDHLCHNADPTCVDNASCRHRSCVNPDHLEPVTDLENFRRAMADGRYLGKRRELVQARPTCPQGHPWSAETVIIRKSGPDAGQWICKQCAAERKAAPRKGTQTPRRTRREITQSKPTCPQGHPWSVETVLIRKSGPDTGQWICRECVAERNRRRRGV